MASLNSVSVIGNLGRDPEVRYSASGDCIVNISVGSTDKWRDKTSGDMKEQTEWHRIAIFGKPAEYISKYAKKGAQIFVHGSLRTRKWQDKDGQDRYTTEIRADDVQLLGSRPQSGGQDSSNAQDDYQDYGAASGGASRQQGQPQTQQQAPRSNGNGQGGNASNNPSRGNDRNQGQSQPARSGGGGYGPSMDDIPF